MSHKLSVLAVSVVCFILVLCPILGMAAQRALTVDSLEKAYKARISAIETEIASANKEIDTLVIKRTASFTDPAVMRKRELSASIVRLNEEKQITEVSYKLLQESFR